MSTYFGHLSEENLGSDVLTFLEKNWNHPAHFGV